MVEESQRCQQLIGLFNELFLNTYNTELVLGGDEPIYLPATADYPHHRVIFAHGYFSSALHEISHWCIAGSERRLLEDFGYWYRPDGRTAVQQAEFELVEVKPQALEWLFNRACGVSFRISCDNLSGETTDTTRFKDRVYQQVLDYLEQGLAARPRMLVERLGQFYQLPALTPDQFRRQDLDW
ncbi:MAG: elongation factor P hydroxylase [Halopseudomonas sp.]